jgi:hypothetical protein
MGPFQVDHIQNPEVKNFIRENPDIDIKAFDFHSRKAVKSLRVRAQVAVRGDAGRRDPLYAVRAFQRTFRLTENVATAEGLAALEFDSAAVIAAVIAAMSPARFLEATKGVFGADLDAALAVHAKAGHLKTAALQLYGSVRELTASPYYGKARFNSASAGLVDYFTNIPSYTSLFGNVNYFETDPGQTIFSPSAYFFDVMRIIDEYILLTIRRLCAPFPPVTV